IRIDDVVLFAGDEPQVLSADAALLQGRQVGVRLQLLLNRFELLTGLGDQRSSVNHGGHGGGEGGGCQPPRQPSPVCCSQLHVHFSPIGDGRMAGVWAEYNATGPSNRSQGLSTRPISPTTSLTRQRPPAARS